MGPLAFLLFAACETWYRYKKDVEKKEVKLKDSLKGASMTEKEFEERIKNGEKLCILDDLVLDVSKYVASEHPGGAFLIN